MSFVPLIIFGLLPSTIWLLFYLRKDAHPESKPMILKVFSYGMLAAIPAALLELGIIEELNKLNLSPSLTTVLYVFVGIALVEETFKYLVVRGKVLKSAELDEPIDVMLYMIISALGFAALENVLVLLPFTFPLHFFETFSISILRFIGATLLHALCSGTLGYFLALSFFETKNSSKLFITGVLTAVLLHGLYNFSIMRIGEPLKFIIPFIILITFSLFVSFAFKNLKKITGVCKIS